VQNSTRCARARARALGRDQGRAVQHQRLL
jgi:hypothetical protein